MHSHLFSRKNELFSAFAARQAVWPQGFCSEGMKYAVVSRNSSNFDTKMAMYNFLGGKTEAFIRMNNNVKISKILNRGSSLEPV